MRAIGFIAHDRCQVALAKTVVQRGLPVDKNKEYPSRGHDERQKKFTYYSI
jgi:hypothetical protein